MYEFLVTSHHTAHWHHASQIRFLKKAWFIMFFFWLPFLIFPYLRNLRCQEAQAQDGGCTVYLTFTGHRKSKAGKDRTQHRRTTKETRAEIWVEVVKSLFVQDLESGSSYLVSSQGLHIWRHDIMPKWAITLLIPTLVDPSIFPKCLLHLHTPSLEKTYAQGFTI